MSVEHAQAVCPKCRRPKMPSAINLSDLPQYCWHEGDLSCVEVQLALARTELDARRVVPT